MSLTVLTGSNGFIGSELLEILNQNNISTLAIDLNHKHKLESKFINYLECDLRNCDIYSYLMKYDVHSIIHLAAHIPDSYDCMNMSSIAESNRFIDDNIITFCENTSTKLIYASSTSVYGNCNSNVVSENHIVHPSNEYARQKLYSENRILSMRNIIRPIILRINAPYGTQQHQKTVLQLFLERAFQNEILYIWGNGSRTQDFTYVDDIARAFQAALVYNGSGIFNISGGNPISMLDLAKLILKLDSLSNSSIEFSNHYDPQEDFRANFDISKAVRKLNWKPSIDLTSGIVECIKYIRGKQC